jgi:hypothetical protein
MREQACELFKFSTDATLTFHSLRPQHQGRILRLRRLFPLQGLSRQHISDQPSSHQRIHRVLAMPTWHNYQPAHRPDALR